MNNKAYWEGVRNLPFVGKCAFWLGMMSIKMYQRTIDNDEWLVNYRLRVWHPLVWVSIVCIYLFEWIKAGVELCKEIKELDLSEEQIVNVKRDSDNGVKG